MKKLLLIVLAVVPLFGRTETGQEVVALLKKKVKYAEDFARLNPDPTITHNSEVQKIKQQIQSIQAQQRTKDQQYSNSQKRSGFVRQQQQVYANEQALVAAQDQRILEMQQQHDQQMNALKQQNAQAITSYKQQSAALLELEHDHKAQQELSVKEQEALHQKLEDIDKEFTERKRLFDAAQEALKKAKEEYNEALKTYHIAAPKL